MAKTETRTGGCLCGKVRYTVPAEPLATVICHCINCQKQAGSAFSIVAIFPRSGLSVDGNPSIYEDRGTSGQKVFRNFCGNCGSPIFSDTEEAREQGVIYVKAGTLDSVSDLNPTAQFWAKRAHPWIKFPDGVQRLDEQ